ncbi:glucan biosynthesis protein G [Celerinatantimonas yamalensis]|uniref:Glucans biosynthesis protein G n=1 Tax=Celerinatantimonas yamalensis TaxID=559956 RepID=A0ABW9G6B4_9GAMM
MSITFLQYRRGWMTLVLLSSLAQPSYAFNLNDVDAQAKALAMHPYQQPQSNLSATFKQLQFAQYQQIHFKIDHAYWQDQDLPFKLAFYHQGMQFDTPVKINEITADGVQPIRYHADDFSFGNIRHDTKAVKNLGFAGFKILYHLDPQHNWDDEVASFLGASYFRVIGPHQVYGLSARGLAINTGEAQPEEFPRFNTYWIEKPKKGDTSLKLYALLNSPSASGAYQFTITPNANGDARVDVKSRIYLRKPVKRLGIAPLTSMYLYGANQPWASHSFRPALHDSNGLAIHTGTGEWIWRPLENPLKDPQYISFSSFAMTNPKGFGLLQRGRNFSQYEDLKDRYDRRPSGWIVPDGDWGKGRVALVELATDNETNDNIVAFWEPDKLPKRGQALRFDYHIDFSTHEQRLRSKTLGYVKQTMRTPGQTYQDNLIRKADGTIEYLIDFAGGELSQLPKGDSGIKSQISVDNNATLISHQLQYNPVTGGRRLALRIKVNNPKKPVEMRANLTKDGHPITETWSYLLNRTDK